MKKQLLMVLAISASLGAFAQNRTAKTRIQLSPNAKPVPVTRATGGANEAPFNTNAALNYVSANSAMRTNQIVTETTIGNTAYDLQTNSAILNRLIRNSDGTLSAAWTMIPPGGASASRGTGYNYFDGSAWGPIPTARIEPTSRTGFVNLVTTASGREMSFGHNVGMGMWMTERPVKGTGVWTENGAALGAQPNDTWAKAISGGLNGETVHVISNASGTSGTKVFGQDGAVSYSRSLDGGVTWPVVRSIIPALDSTHYLGWGGDSYSIDTKGDLVAIVVGDFTTDLILVKSLDNGNTWASTVIQPFFKAFYDDTVDSLPDLDGDGSSDRIEAPSGDAHVMIDNNGVCHVFWSNVLITDTSAADALGYFPNGIDGGILYWNENFGANAPDTIAEAEDLDGDGNITIASGSGGGGEMGLYRTSVTAMPTSGIDAAGNLFVAYQTLCENCDTTAFGTSHKHIYVKASTDGGSTWGAKYDIDQSTDALNEECAFACMAKNVGANIDIIYQRDAAPGHSLLTGSTIATTQAGWNSNPSDIIHAGFPASDVLGIKNVKTAATSLSLSQNSPNPSTGVTSIKFALSAQANVSFDVTDVLGNVVYSEAKGNLSAGSYNISLVTENLSTGVYFYTLTVDAQKETKKLMVK